MNIYKYRFSLGNTTSGQVGFCFDVRLKQKKQDATSAVKVARKVLKTVDHPLHVLPTEDLRVEDPIVWLNVKQITTKDIVDVRRI